LNWNFEVSIGSQHRCQVVDLYLADSVAWAGWRGRKTRASACTL